jgi:hypothetical protein
LAQHLLVATELSSIADLENAHIVANRLTTDSRRRQILDF